MNTIPKNESALFRLYYQVILQHPKKTLLFVVLVLGFLALFANKFKLDASGESLILENDQDYRYYQSISAKYNSDDFLIITYTPKEDLFALQTRHDVQSLRDELLKLPRVAEVTTYLDVPLINSPKVTFAQIVEQIQTLMSPDTDIELARKEFIQSPIYKNLLVNDIGKTTAIQINFKRDVTYTQLRKRQDELRAKRLQSNLTSEEEHELKKVTSEFKQHSSNLQNQESQDILSIRSIIQKYRDRAEIHLGGLPMIVSDMIQFISHDIKVFGIGVILFIILLLTLSFKKPRWIVIPVIICIGSVLGMIGYLGLVEWRVTVVSSNFISLLLIITLSLTVHLIVRYQELHAQDPDAEQKNLISQAIRSKIVPSFYTTTTTMVAFGSLLVSGIRPVIDFGWMMVFGVGMAFVLAFLIFPASLTLIKPGLPIQRRHDTTGKITGFLGEFIEHNSLKTLFFFACLVIFTTVGVSKLSVENRFIDYFKDTTEIYQGMLKIDRELGGTTPLEIVLDADQEFIQDMKDRSENDDEFIDEDNAGLSGTSYWFNIFQLETVSKVHAYLDNLPETGKVLSLHSTMDMLTQLNDGEPLNNIVLSVLYKRLPDEIKKTLFRPYMSADGNQVRLSVRVFESDYSLRRQHLLEKIKHDLVNDLGLEKEQVHLTGMVVLYNNMLQSLFTSQILTIGVVFLAILLMFLILFKSLKISLIAIIPNMVAASLVLGMMGWLNIPLDIMTITIAAITIGIAVDNSIHYIHRFQIEYEVDKNYWSAVKRCHISTGRAMYYTSMTITIGFSILALSNFIPTIYFGLFTGMAMVTALLANLTLLPILLVTTKSMGKDPSTT